MPGQGSTPEKIREALRISREQFESQEEVLRLARQEIDSIRAQLVNMAVVAEQISENVCILGPDWTIRYVNPSYEKGTGYTKEEVAGRPIETIWPESGQEAFFGTLRDVVEKGKTWCGRISTRKKDGSSFEMEGVVSPVRDDKGAVTGYVATGRDVAERLNLQEQVRQMQKTEAVGTLAGGIAHDFNNILAGIIGFTELALDDVPQGSPLERPLRFVLKGAMRGRDLVAQIHSFSRKTSLEKERLNLKPLLKETVKFLRSTLPATIHINLDIQADSDVIFGDPSQIHQIVLNLGTNAADAMDETGGELMISLYDVGFKEGDPCVEGTEPGDYLQLTVRDRGTGMDEDIKGKIFEPFFTTRKAQGRSGLGLAVTREIVTSLRGTIAVESEPGVGSIVKVSIPKAPVKAVADGKSEVDVPRGTERILFIDDEELLVQWGQAILGRLGYEVTGMTDSVRALEIFSQDPSRFDLVITDQTMPGLTGVQLAGAILKLRPKFPILLCTGRTGDVHSGKIARASLPELLTKPLTRNEIAGAVRRILDQAKHR